jgi:hypothetical protein
MSRLENAGLEGGWADRRRKRDCPIWTTETGSMRGCKQL